MEARRTTGRRKEVSFMVDQLRWRERRRTSAKEKANLGDICLQVRAWNQHDHME